jgi:hypothetical protein
LIQVLDTQTFRGPDDFARLLPPDLPETFTTADIASGLAVPVWLAQKRPTACGRWAQLHWWVSRDAHICMPGVKGWGNLS